MEATATIGDLARAITPGGGSGTLLGIGLVMVFLGLLCLSFVRDETTLDALNDVPAEEERSVLKFFTIVTVVLVLWTSVGAAWVISSFSTLTQGRQERKAHEVKDARTSEATNDTNEGLTPVQQLLMGR